MDIYENFDSFRNEGFGRVQSCYSLDKTILSYKKIIPRNHQLMGGTLLHSTPVNRNTQWNDRVVARLNFNYLWFAPPLYCLYFLKWVIKNNQASIIYSTQALVLIVMVITAITSAGFHLVVTRRFADACFTKTHIKKLNIYPTTYVLAGMAAIFALSLIFLFFKFSKIVISPPLFISYVIGLWMICALLPLSDILSSRKDSHLIHMFIALSLLITLFYRPLIVMWPYALLLIWLDS